MTIKDIILENHNLLNADQMNEIVFGLREGLTPDEIFQYAKVKFTPTQMKEMRNKILKRKGKK